MPTQFVVTQQRQVQIDVAAKEIDVVGMQSETQVVVSTSTPPVSVFEAPGPQGSPGTVGPTGPAGADGSDASDVYTFSQTSASTTWHIEHDLGRPITAVLLEDTDGRAFVGTLTVIDNDNCQLDFAIPVAGTAYIS